MTVDSPAVALFFADSSRVMRLFPFIEAERSLAEAARALRVSKSLMSYWVGVMRRLGLLEVARVERRGRHRVPVYRATASGFRVPLELLPRDAGEGLRRDLLRFVEEPLEAALTRRVAPHPQDWHILCTVRDGQNWLTVQPNSGGLDQQDFVHRIGRIRLSPARAEAFRRELRALLERFEAEGEPEGRFYFYQGVMVEDSS